MEAFMKSRTIAAIAAPFILTIAQAQAGDYPAQDTNVCLYTYQIDRTDVPDERTILFHMKDGKVWTSNLPRRCPGLRFYGFSYVVRGNDQICGNLDSIRVLKTGSVCQLGPFVAEAADKPD